MCAFTNSRRESEAGQRDRASGAYTVSRRRAAEGHVAAIAEPHLLRDRVNALRDGGFRLSARPPPYEARWNSITQASAGTGVALLDGDEMPATTSAALDARCTPARMTFACAIEASALRPLPASSATAGCSSHQRVE